MNVQQLAEHKAHRKAEQIRGDELLSHYHKAQYECSRIQHKHHAEAVYQHSKSQRSFTSEKLFFRLFLSFGMTSP